MKNKRIVVIIATALILVIAAVLIAFYVFKWSKPKSAEEVTESIVEEANEVEDDDEPDVLNGIEIPEKNLDWDELANENPDIYAWVYVPDADVDYPVLQHENDDSYYLNHNIDGTSGYPGVIYTEPSYTSKDFTDNNTVIYGHNMNNGSMFAGLHTFEDPESFEGDHYIFIYTQKSVYVYQIYAAYEYTAIHLLANDDMSNPYIFEEYLENIKDYSEYSERVNEYRDDIEVTKEDKIITLSTCTNPSNESYRYIVQGVFLGSVESDD